MVEMTNRHHFLLIMMFWLIVLASVDARSEVAVIDVSCASCGYRERFIQGADGVDQAHNVQNIIVVCERTRQIRNIKIPIDPGAPSPGNPCWHGDMETEGLNYSVWSYPGSLFQVTHVPYFPLRLTLNQIFVR